MVFIRLRYLANGSEIYIKDDAFPGKVQRPSKPFVLQLFIFLCCCVAKKIPKAYGGLLATGVTKKKWKMADAKLIFL